MSNLLAKELRPLFLPAGIAVAGAMIPPVNELSAMLSALACFGGFAVLAATTFGLEFQQHTLTLLLSQPVERRRIWQDKILIVLLAGIAVIMVNWQFQQLLSDLPGWLLLLVWMFLLACVCSSGFWIQSTGSVLGGLACDVTIQLLLFGGLALAIKSKYELSIGLAIADGLRTIILPSVIYSLAFLWLGRQFWQRTFLKIGVGLVLFLLLCGLSQCLASSVGVRRTSVGEAFLAGIFLLALMCSTGFWTLVARTTLGGAVLSVASQFLVGVAALLALSKIYGAEVDTEQVGMGEEGRFLGPLALIAILYCVIFLALGWRKFARLELKSAPAGLEQTSGGSYHGGWSPNWLQCRANQNLLNLVRKELRLQKPLLLLAGIFLICWLAAVTLQWLAPQRAYAHLKDVVACVYAPLVLLLAGCVSLGDEKVLGVTGWHLTLPIAARTQWLVKLVVAALSGATLGLVLPFILYSLSALVTGAQFLRNSINDPFLLVASISSALFILSFWAATLLTGTVRAALSAVAALIAFSLCIALGNACAEHLELLRDVFSPITFGLIVPLSQAIGVLNPGALVIIVGFAVAVATALFQSFRQFRRVQLPAAVLVKRPLALAAVFLLLGILVRATA